MLCWLVGALVSVVLALDGWMEYCTGTARGSGFRKLRRGFSGLVRRVASNEGVFGRMFAWCFLGCIVIV